MKHSCRISMVALLILALLATPLLSCGKEAENGKVIITIGELNDFTGPIATACVDPHWALTDVVKYINEEDPIPEAEIRVVSYDTRYDMSREKPGYDWLREQGAEVIVTVLANSAEINRSFAAIDKTPLFSLSTSPALLEPPGWVFTTQCLPAWELKPLLDWISDHWTNYPTKPKMGFVSVSSPFSIQMEEAVQEYCLANPDKFEFVRACRAPVGTMTWSGEVAKLKDCDWIGIALDPISMALFIEQLRLAGNNAQLFSQEFLLSCVGVVTDKIGWEAIDTSLAAAQGGWWNETYPTVELAKDLLYEYHSEEAEDIIHAGIGYVGATGTAIFFTEILRAAIEEVGAENFDGQAFYNTALDFEYTFEGYQKWNFSENKRYCQNHVAIYEFRAAEEDAVRVSDWMAIEPD